MDKRSPSKCKFPDFRLLAWKLTKFLKSFFKPQVSFPLNFASPFSVMTHNFFEIFYLKHYMLLTKKAHKCTIFQTLSALIKVHLIPHAVFETTVSGFIQILHHCWASWKIISMNLFCSNLIYFGQKYPIKAKFLDFWVVGWKFTKLLVWYLKPQVSFSVNLASLFNVTRDNSSFLL